jgi:CelD/BcsL family acetyltransferase involved in cellulose biosynthesis/GNAT superfamily N-acetyltransferase
VDTLVVAANLALDDRSAAAAPVTSRAVTTLGELEDALAGGLSVEWASLVENDPSATLFQTAGWCLPWYRLYADSFDPYLILVTSGGRLVGLVPMAVDRAARTLVFASNTMADYRDVVALPGYRGQVVGELMRLYLDGRFANTLQIGWLDPASETLTLVEHLCARRGLRYTVRRQPCWRWFPPAPAKPSAQKFLNWYKRNGGASFDVIDSEPAWQRFREEYYRQHTLRQIQAGRQTAFDDTRKAALYDALFHSPDIQPHVTAFVNGERMLAGHFGYVWRGVLLLGPPSIRLEDEQRSPAVILLSWIIQNAERLGLKGFDLTIGESDFKKRLGNQCVELSMVEVYANASAYYLDAARDATVNAAKRAVERAAGPDTWKTRIKPAAEALQFEAARAAELGVTGAVRALATTAARGIYDSGLRRTYAFTPESIATNNAAAPLGGDVLRENAIEDLLLWKGTSPSVQAAMTACARTYARFRNTGHTFYALVSDGALAGWCYASSGEIHDAFVLPELRGTPAALNLLRGVAQRRFAEGAPEVRLTLSGRDTMLQPAAAACARLADETSAPRIFGSARLFDRVTRVWKRLTWRAIRRRIALAFSYAAEERIYRLSPADAADLPASEDFARDRWEDLELFQPTEPRHTRDACLADWRQRLARGEHVFTRVEDGRLAAYGWLVDRQKTMPLTWVNQSVELPDGSAVLYDYYTLPEYRHRDFYQRLLMHAMQDAARIPGTSWVCLSILASDRVPRWWVERIGMTCVGQYFYTRNLWMRRTWQQVPAIEPAQG